MVAPYHPPFFPLFSQVDDDPDDHNITGRLVAFDTGKGIRVYLQGLVERIKWNKPRVCLLPDAPLTLGCQLS